MDDLPLRIAGPVTLVGGGPFTPEALARARAAAPVVVAADRGADALAALGCLPQAVVGDMDSIADLAAWEARATRVLHLAEQDTTDFEKCLYATEAPIYVALGFTGGRLDHTLAVLHAMLRHPEKPVVLLGEAEAMAFVPPRRPLTVPVSPGARVSLFPLAETTGTRSAGLHWPVDGLTMAPGRQVGTSNRASAGRVTVAFDRPGALLMVETASFEGLLAAVAGVARPAG